MGALTASRLLGAWERALSQSPAQRALTLLQSVGTELPPERLAALSIGQRDAYLLNLRESAFGSQMTGLTPCPACSRQLEVSFTVSSVRVASPTDPVGPCTLTHADYQVDFRLPNGEDLTSLTPDLDRSANQRRLLERCLLNVRRNGEAVPFDEFPAELRTAVSERMAETDPQADVQLSLACPDCDHRWQAPLDIVSYLWAEIHEWATRLLRDIHTLASAYGWREADILALSPWRRQAYLEMINR
jgi:hypothetical protein